jgi:MinD superfamily P-loop ATPase
MKIAVLSGKGGTGKTLVSVNLTAAAEQAVYIDCDVEEPNGHLFFKPESIEQEEIAIKIPVVDPTRCSGCRRCVDFCKFNALAHTGRKLIIFSEVCHSCGGCMLLCPEKALYEKDKGVGFIRRGVSQNVRVVSGILNPGEASGIPIIKKALQYATEDDGLTVIDCPPGSACIAMESIREADYCILVAEPTLFGVYNLGMVHELVRLFGKPHGVVLNKCLEEENPSEKYCMDQGIPILGKIPFNKEIGRLNADALIMTRESAEFRELFSSLLHRTIKEACYEAAFNSQR